MGSVVWGLVGPTFVIIAAVAFIGNALIIPFRIRRKEPSNFLPGCIASLLLFVGAVGFFGSGISGIGGMNWLPPSFEWPVGFASGIIRTYDGFYVVPLDACGRIQVYDAQWKFVRGWPFPSFGHPTVLRLSAENKIEVYTHHKYFDYDIEGRPLESGDALEKHSKTGETIFVPTAWFLLVFTSPFLSGLFIALGLALILLIERKKLRRVGPLRWELKISK